jgi:hypothetical protein
VHYARPTDDYLVGPAVQLLSPVDDAGAYSLHLTYVIRGLLLGLAKRTADLLALARSGADPKSLWVARSLASEIVMPVCRFETRVILRYQTVIRHISHIK